MFTPQTCHVSLVTCPVSRVTCHFFFFFSFGQSVETSRWRVCYQQGLPCLVFLTERKYFIFMSLLAFLFDWVLPSKVPYNTVPKKTGMHDIGVKVTDQNSWFNHRARHTAHNLFKLPLSHKTTICLSIAICTKQLKLICCKFSFWLYYILTVKVVLISFRFLGL